MEHFIYVKSKAGRDLLLEAGYRMLKADEKRDIYVFENNPSLKFSLAGFPHVLTNNLKFA